jgi:hypothetical protein
MFARQPDDVIPSVRQSLGAKRIMVMFFTAKNLIVMDVPPKAMKLNQLYFVHYIFPDVKSKT